MSIAPSVARVHPFFGHMSYVHPFIHRDKAGGLGELKQMPSLDFPVTLLLA